MSGSYTGEGEKLPILILTCQKDSHPFQERTIVLNEVIKVGRSVARAKPADTNAIFDCKVLSRSHALIWYKNGRFWLRDTNSSNGTFVNNTRVVKRPGEEYADREIFSGDVIRFGVDVVEHETTHGCIIARVTLLRPGGAEAKLCTEPVGPANGMLDIETLHAEQVFRLAHFVTEALFREQVLENKLTSMSRLLQETREMSEAGWQAMLNEERLLHTLDLYESQLSTLKQDLPPDSLQARLCQVLEEKVNVEKASELMLNRLVKEKAEALSKVTTLECCLSDFERECARLRQDCEKTSEAYQAITRDYNEKFLELSQLEKQVKDVQAEKDKLESQLLDRIKEAEVLQKNFDVLVSAKARASKSLPDTSDELLEASDLNLSLNGLGNGPMENPERIGDQVGVTESLHSALNRRADLLREDIVTTELMEPNRLSEIQDRLADSEASLEQVLNLTHDGLAKHLADSVHQFSQSMQLIKSLQNEINLLSQLNLALGRDIRSVSSNTAVSDEQYMDQSERLLSATESDDPEFQKHAYSASLSRVKSISARVAACHARVEASLSTCCALQRRLQIAPLVCTTSGDVCNPGSNPIESTEQTVKVGKLPIGIPSVADAQTSPRSCDLFHKHSPDSNSPPLIDSEAQSSVDEMEIDNLKEQLRVAQNEMEHCRQMANTYKLQDAAKAELLLTVREECETLRRRIAHIEADVTISREDHQRLVNEARRTRSEADELRGERDALNKQVITCTHRIEQLQAALIRSNDFGTTTSAGQQNADSVSHPSANNPVSIHLLTETSSATPFRSLSGTLSLFVVVPVMISLFALIVYVHSKFV